MKKKKIHIKFNYTEGTQDSKYKSKMSDQNIPSLLYFRSLLVQGSLGVINIRVGDLHLDSRPETFLQLLNVPSDSILETIIKANLLLPTEFLELRAVDVVTEIIEVTVGNVGDVVFDVRAA